MMRGRGWAERLLRQVVGNPESVEGLLGDLEEERRRRGGAIRFAAVRYRWAVLRIASRYLIARDLRDDPVARRPPRRRALTATGGFSGRGPRVPLDLARHVRFAARSFLRAPGYAAALALTLALGLGATTAVFTVLDAVVIRPLAYERPHELVRLESAVPGLAPGARWHLAKAQFLFLRDNARGLAEAGLYTRNVATVFSPDASHAQRVRTAFVDPGVARTLAVQPVLGRMFRPAESLTRAPNVVVLTHGYWQRAYGGDPAVIGTTLRAEGSSLRVVGVLPPEARLPEESHSSRGAVDLWLPLHLDPADSARNNHIFRSIARLAPDLDAEAASVELAQLSARLPEAFPEAYGPEFMQEYAFRTVATPLHEDVVGDVAGALWIVFASVGLLLLVAGFNGANLVLAHVQRRQRELAIRSALGAGVGRLARQLVLEACLLAIASGAAALVVARWAVAVLVAQAPAAIPRLDEVALGWGAAGFALSLSLLVGTALGLVAVARAGVGRVLSLSGRGLTPSRGQHTVRRALVVGQLAVSLVLLAGAALLLRSFQNLAAVETGVVSEGLLTFRVVLPWDGYGSYQEAGVFYRQATMRLEALPGVSRVGTASALPLSGFDGCAHVQVADRPPRPSEPPPCLPVMLVGPGYFEAMGIPVQGTTATWSDIEQGNVVGVVSAAFAERFWPGTDPLGRQVLAFGPTATVAGVAGDVRGAGLDAPAWEALYLSFTPPPGSGPWSVPRFLHFAVRTDAGEPDAYAPAVRRTIAELDPGVAVTDLRTMEGIVAASTARVSFTTLLIGTASAFSLLLSALGVYAVVSFLVQGRRAEIGVRLALGARLGEVHRMVVGQSMIMGVVGVTLGLIGAFATTRALTSLLFEVRPADPLVLGVAAAGLLGLTAVAAHALARRATHIDPVEALRSE